MLSNSSLMRSHPSSSARMCFKQENQQLTQLRDWLLPLLMNGQVTVA